MKVYKKNSKLLRSTKTGTDNAESPSQEPRQPQIRFKGSDEMTIDEVSQSMMQRFSIVSYQEPPPIIEEETPSSVIEFELPPLLAQLFASVVDEAIDQLKIVVTTLSCPAETIDLEIKPLRERLENVREYGSIYDPQNLQNYKDFEKQHRKNKFHRDISLLSEILKSTFRSICIRQTYHPLVNYIETYKNKVEEEEYLLKDTAEKAKKIEKLQEELMNNRSKYLSTMNKLNKQTAKAKDHIQELISEYALKMRYIKRWENSRRELNAARAHGKETDNIAKIEDYNLRMELENRAFAAIARYCNESVKDAEAASEYWSNKYDEDAEELDIKISTMEQKLLDQAVEIEELRDTLQLHEEQMEAWLKYRAQREIEIEIERKTNEAALKIQTWFRGIIVRNHLVEKKSKKKKKK